MRIGFRHKLLLAITSLIFLVLLVQGVLSGSMVLDMLEKRAMDGLTREAGAKAQVLTRLARQSEEDLTILAAHRDNENYFTYRKFQDSDGMEETLSGLDLFLGRVQKTKPRYHRIQLAAREDGKPVLQLNQGASIQRFDTFDPDGVLRQAILADGKSLHRVLEEHGKWRLLSAGPVWVDGEVEGFLFLFQPIDDLIATLMRELADARITAVLRDHQNGRIAATPGFQPSFLAGGADSEWITVATDVPTLGWRLTVGMPRSESFHLFRNLFIAALFAAAALVAVIFYFVWKVIQALKEYNRLLERQVAERTRQLEHANEEIRQLNENLKLENRRMGAELEVARRIQSMVLPREEELVAIPHLEVATFMESASEVGGDYYDVLALADGRVCIGIGDVTGHGLESGVVMLMTQSAVRTLASCVDGDPRQRMAWLNHTIFENVKRMGCDKNLTLSLADYQPGAAGGGVLRVSGQHESVLVARARGGLEVVDTMDLGMPIGLLEEMAEFVNETEIHLSAGDVAVFYTDGICEAENPGRGFYGLERLCGVVEAHAPKGAAAVREAVVADVKRHLEERPLLDDLTLVVVRQK